MDTTVELPEFLFEDERLQKLITQLAIPPSATRHHRGLRARAIGWLGTKAQLDELVNDYSGTLDDWTKELSSGAKELWGPCRKAVNLFVRGCAYNHFMRSKHALDSIEFRLEVPLDQRVMSGIRRDIEEFKFEGHKLKKTPIKELCCETSKAYQIAANEIANRHKVARIHLDTKYWPKT